MEQKTFENYPLSTVFIVGVITVLIWATGIYLVWQLGALWGILFILYILAFEFSTYKKGCASCYYYGKWCAFGRSKVAPLFVKKKDAQKFCQRKVTWVSMLPIFLGNLVPVAAGIFLLVKGFTWPILILTSIPVINWFLINPLIFGGLVCPHCGQGRLCCPAGDFFKKMQRK